MPKIDIKSIFLIISLFGVGGSGLFAHQATANNQLNNQPVFLKSSLQAPRFTFTFPDIDLIDHRNQPRVLSELFDKDRNVVFAFFFSHCVSVCTTITLSLKSIAADLPPDTLIAMISIDPDTDTPDLLKSYAKQHQIDEPNWYLLTGGNKDIINLQKSFESYRGNKMNHTTSLFIKKSGADVITEIKNNFSDIPKLLITS